MKFRFAIFCLTALASAVFAETPVYQVGVTSFRDRAVTFREWQPTIDYLSSKVKNARFEVVPLDLEALKHGVESHHIDFVITNPEHYIVLEYLYGVSRVATLVKISRGKLVRQFGGVIFIKAGRSDIHDLADLKNKRISAVDESSFAGFLLQKDTLNEVGINPGSNTGLVFDGFPQDRTVYSVLEGKADAGFVRSGLLEAMADEGKIALSDVKVLNQHTDPDFPFLLSTKLYPEWAFAVTKHVPYGVTNQVVAALMLMPPGSEITKAARYDRWVTPLEYLSVQNLMRKHRVYPFNVPARVTLGDFVRQYNLQVIFSLMLVLTVIGVMYNRTRRLNDELQKSKAELKLMAHYDHLTGLPNRRVLEHDIEKAVANSQRNTGMYALAMLDLDRFKPINDQLGHEVGDAVLKCVANTLKECVRAGDTVARWGGDEFVLLFSFSGLDHMKSILDRVLSKVSSCSCLAGVPNLSASVGVVMIDGSVKDSSKLLKIADDAMYVAKNNGGHSYAFSSLSHEGATAN